MNNNPNRVVFINNLGLGGAERVVSRLFSNKNLNTLTALWVLNSSDFYNDVNIQNKVNLQRGGFTSLNTLLNLLRLKKGTLVQAHLNMPILFSTFAKFLGAKFELQAVHCFAYSSFYKRRGFKGKIHRLAFGLLLKNVHTHIFKAKEMVDDFEDVFGWRPSSYSVIYNPYDIEQITLSAQQPLLTNEQLDNNKMNVAVVGRLNESKRVFDIINIANETANFAVYHLFGDGPLREELSAKIKAKGMNNIVLHGMVSNPFKYVRQCGVYLSLSESEGFPNALVESMICGAIPIHSDCKTGPKEILCDDFESFNLKKGDFNIADRGLLFGVGDKSAALKAITHVYNNRIELNELFKQPHLEYIQSVALDTILNKYSKILKITD